MLMTQQWQTWLVFSCLLKLQIEKRKIKYLQTQATVYEIVSDLAGRQDQVDDRLAAIEGKMQVIHETLETLPQIINQSLVSYYAEAAQSTKHLLHPESAAASGSPQQQHSHNLPHSKSVPTSATLSANKPFLSTASSITSGGGGVGPVPPTAK